MIIDKAFAALPGDLSHFDEKRLAVGILVAGEVFAVKFRTHRMHHHGRLEVINPEIIILRKTGRFNRVLGKLLRLFARQRALRLLSGEMIDNPPDRFNRMLNFGMLGLVEAGARLGIDPADGCSENQYDESAEDEDLGSHFDVVHVNFSLGTTWN